MRRRELLIAALAAAAAPGALAQRRPVKIGVLTGVPHRKSNYVPGILQRLAQAGYQEGSGMVVEARSSDGLAERYPALALELIEHKCDLIFAVGPWQAAAPFRRAASPAPIVFLAVDYDPVEKGIVPSLVRPGGTITGVYVPQAGLIAKRVEIMREVAQGAQRFLVFTDDFSRDQLGAAEKAARAAGVELTVVDFKKPPYDFAGGFAAGRKANAGGFVMLGSPEFGGNAARLAALGNEFAMPGIGASAGHARNGMLLSLGADIFKTTQRVGDIAVRILKGAKPADIPVEQADEFDLIVNLRTAKALNLKVPYSVLARATRVIE